MGAVILPLFQPTLPILELTQWLVDDPTVSAKIFPSAATSTALEWVPPLETDEQKTKQNKKPTHTCMQESRLSQYQEIVKQVVLLFSR